MPWYFQRGEEEIVGPIDLETLHTLAESGEIDGNTQVAYAESGQQPDAWQLAHSIKSLNLGSGLPRTPRPPQPAAQRIPATASAPVQNAPVQARPVVVLSGYGPITIVILVVALLGIAVGMLAMGYQALSLLDDFEYAAMVLVSLAPNLFYLGLHLIVIALLFELVRVNRGSLLLLHRQQSKAPEGVVHQPRPQEQPQQVQQPQPRAEKHPLD